MEVFNKQDLVDAVHSENGGSRYSAERTVDLIINTIKNNVKLGAKVSIAGFGIFTKKAMSAKTARNPRTGETVKVPAQNKAKFAPAKGFKEFINNK